MTLASTDWRGGLAVVALLAGCAQEYQVAAPIDVDPADVLECAFSPISGTQLSVYDCNPVFAGTDENWGQGFRSVGFRTQSILGHPFYQIWYSATPDGDLGDYGLGYAVSGDGTNWETHAGNPVIDTARGWDDDLMDQVRVVWDADSAEYVLAYQGFNLREGTFGIGMFTSPDGVD
ncbi:MAG: hypothetical protein KTR31_36455 [Myxococcales bacterium]|nr:hypothetical protein [Myxococcales bacterium]